MVFLGLRPRVTFMAQGRALPALGPYRKLHDDPETATYYLMTEVVAGAAARAASFGAVTPLGGRVFLLAARRGNEKKLAAAGLKAELFRLQPGRLPARRRAAAEPPPNSTPKSATPLIR